MKKIILGTFIILVTVILVAFNIRPCISAQSGPELSINYLNEKGYEIVEYIGRKTITFSEDHISLRDIYRLTLINNDYKNLMNKEIIIDSYMVTNHPLDNNLKRFIRTIQMGLRVNYPNMTRVQVAIINNEIVGGFSNIHYTGPKMLGAASYDIEGNSIETKTGVTFDAWRENVMKEFEFNY
jgi:hypothetical protein